MEPAVKDEEGTFFPFFNLLAHFIVPNIARVNSHCCPVESHLY